MDKVLLYLGLLIAVLAAIGDCLECHECTTIVDNACLDPYDVNANADFVSECDGGSHCVKYKTVIKLRDSGYIVGWERDSIVVTRSCEPTKGLSTGCVRWQGNGGFTIKCRCDKDGCNSSTHNRPTILAVLASVGLAFFLKMFR